MKNTEWLMLLGLGTAFCFGFTYKTILAKKTEMHNDKKVSVDDTLHNNRNLKLGAFSVSLNVKDLKVSREFYENLGFKILSGAMEKNYLIMKNENSLVGLFQGMFQGNILTFNPGWDDYAKNIQKFDDVRDIQKHLLDNHIRLTTEAITSSTGPASIMLSDPDGNVILIDQHRSLIST